MEKIYKKSKIRIVLIDDEPSRELKDGNELRIHKKVGVENFDGIEDLFDLRWLRTTEDVKKYLDYLQHCEAYSTIGIINEGITIPEIICFDYSLDKGRSNAQLFSENHFSNPFTEIESFFTTKGVQVLPDIGDQPEFELTAFPTNKRFDLFGCYCGGLLVKQFKDYISIGIPTTQRSASDVEGSYVEVFEWLINYDLKDAFDIKHRQEPYWQQIIGFAVKKLRDRIKLQVISGKIKPALLQLLEIASGIIPDKRDFTFSSIYGIRNLPLDGLFIDKSTKPLTPIPDDVKTILEDAIADGKISKVEIIERDYEIMKFASGLLKTLAELSGIETNTISKAKKITEDLWTAATGDVLKERFKLSELFAKKYLAADKLNEEESELFERYCGADYYNVSDCEEIASQIKNNKEEDKKAGKLKPHVNKRIFSIREYHKNDEADNKIKIVLVTLFLAIRLDYHFKQHRRKNSENEKSNSLSTEFTGKPTLKELLYVLFPSPKIPILMPGHLQFGGNDFKRKILDDQFQKYFSRADASGINWTTLPDDLDFSNIITPGEKVICQSYATEIGMNKEDYPQWLI